MSLLCRNLMCRWSPSLGWPSSNSSSEVGEILAFPQLPPPHQQAHSRLGGEAFDLDRDPPRGPFKFYNWTFRLPHAHLGFKTNASACSHLIWEFRPSPKEKTMNCFFPVSLQGPVETVLLGKIDIWMLATGMLMESCSAKMDGWVFLIHMYETLGGYSLVIHERNLGSWTRKFCPAVWNDLLLPVGWTSSTLS